MAYTHDRYSHFGIAAQRIKKLVRAVDHWDEADIAYAIWQEFGPAADVCEATGIQRCSECERWTCGDNTNPDKNKVAGGDPVMSHRLLAGFSVVCPHCFKAISGEFVVGGGGGPGSNYKA